MTSTVFQSGTVIDSVWLNDVDALVYQGQLDNGTTGASISRYLPAGTGAVPTTVQSKLRESVSVKDFGAVGDGVTNDRNALQAALTYATTNNVPLYVPKGTYYVPNDSTALTFTGNLTMYGDGMLDSIIFYDDSVQTTVRNFLVANVCGNLVLSDLCIQADWGLDGNYDENSQLTFFVGTGVETASISRCRFSRSRYMALIIGNFERATVTHCVFDNTVADACRITGSNQVLIANNQFKNTGDNAIAVQSEDQYPFPARGDIVIADNTLVDTAGISCLGGKKLAITGNTVTRPYTLGIQVGQPSLSADFGVTPVLSILIANNVITDVFKGTTFVVGGGNDGGYIKVEGVVANDIGNGYIGGSDGSGGVLEPYPYLYTNNMTALTQNPGNYFILIEGNVCARTLGPVAAYSDYGFGPRIGRDGPVDPAITYASFNGQGSIRIRNTTTGLKISNNIVSGATDYGIYLQADTGLSNQSWNNVSIEHNTIHNISTNATLNAGIYVIGKGVVSIHGNTLDLDPYHISPFRVANGKWDAGFSSFGALALAEVTARISDNIFRNTGSISLLSATTNHIWGNNTLMCNPVDYGGGADNIGIRFVNRPVATYDASLIVADDDPSSATFNTTLNVCPLGANSIPTTGKYVQGYFVKKSDLIVAGAGGSQYVVNGWLRLTTGSAHVLNTDWAEMRTLTGT